jgi:hypothetical protein
MQTLLTTDAEQAAQQTGVIQRVRQFTGPTLAQTLVFGWLANPRATLGDLAATAACCGVTVSPQGLDQRFTPTAAQFLEQLLARAVRHVVEADPVAVPLLRRFAEVDIRDSTVLTLPDALAEHWPGCGGSTSYGGKAALRFQVRLSLCTGRLRGLTPQPARLSDQAASNQEDDLPPGSLRLADLGYFNLSAFQRWQRHGSYFLSRLLPGTKVYDADGQELSLARWLDRQPGKHLDVAIQLGAEQRLPCRLLVERVPAAVVRQRRARIRKDAVRRGKPASAAKLELAAWTLYVTNVPAEKLSVVEALALARARWQIELLFKLWKEHGLLDEWRSDQPWRMVCEIFAKLVGLVIQHWVLLVSQWQHVHRSLRKAAPKLRQHVLHLASVLSSVVQVVAVLRLIQRCLAVGCRIHKSRQTPRTGDILKNPSLSHSLT